MRETWRANWACDVLEAAAMKKQGQGKRLPFQAELVRVLADKDLKAVAGGKPNSKPTEFICVGGPTSGD